MEPSTEYTIALLLPPTAESLLKSDIFQDNAPDSLYAIIGTVTTEDINSVIENIKDKVTVNSSVISATINDIIEIKQNDDSTLKENWEFGLYAAVIGKGKFPEITKAIIEAVAPLKFDTSLNSVMPLSLEESFDTTKAIEVINRNLVFDKLIITNEQSKTDIVLDLENFNAIPYFVSYGYKECDSYAVVNAESKEVEGCYDSELAANEKMDKIMDELTSPTVTTIEQLQTLDYGEVSIQEAASDPILSPQEPPPLKDQKGHPLEGLIVATNTFTGDRRIIKNITVAEGSLPLMFIDKRTSHHEESVLCGTISEVIEISLPQNGDTEDERLGYYVMGYFHRTPAGYEAYDLVDSKYLNTVSVDLDSISGYIDDDGNSVIETGRIIGATLVPFPAMREARIYSIFGEGIPEEVMLECYVALKQVEDQLIRPSLYSLSILSKIVSQNSIGLKDLINIKNSIGNDPNSIFSLGSMENLIVFVEQMTDQDKDVKQFLLRICPDERE